MRKRPLHRCSFRGLPGARSGKNRGAETFALKRQRSVFEPVAASFGLISWLGNARFFTRRTPGAHHCWIVCQQWRASIDDETDMLCRLGVAFIIGPFRA